MNSRKILHSRTTSVIAGSALLVTLGGVSGAFAASQITSQDIKDGQVKKPDVGTGAVGAGEVLNKSLGTNDISDNAIAAMKGQKGDQGEQGVKGDKGDKGDPGDPATYAGSEWSVIDRNVIGNGDAYLRAGPSSKAFGQDVSPPLGVGSLGIRTGSATDKAAFGDQTDFVGDKLADVNAVKFSVFTTGENGAGNLPNIAVEVDPGVKDANGNDVNFSTLNFVPETAKANEWSEVDASAAKRWYLTGAAGTATGCNQTTYCTLDDLHAKAKDATIYTVAFSKGSDKAFTGAVDKLVWNTDTYDFEPFGVKKTTS